MKEILEEQKEQGGQPRVEPKQVKDSVAIITFLAMFGCAILCVSTDPKSLIFVPMFPLGLFIFLAAGGSFLLVGISLVVSYAIYVVLFLAMLRAKKWTAFGAICFILAIVLLLNVSGCKQTIQGLSNIN
jgi:hypothetical protein